MLPTVDMIVFLSVSLQTKCHAEFIAVFLRPTNTCLLTPMIHQLLHSNRELNIGFVRLLYFYCKI